MGAPRDLEKEAYVIELLNAGMPVGEVARETGIHRNSVRNIRKRQAPRESRLRVITSVGTLEQFQVFVWNDSVWVVSAKFGGPKASVNAKELLRLKNGIWIAGPWSGVHCVRIMAFQMVKTLNSLLDLALLKQEDAVCREIDDLVEYGFPDVAATG